MRPRNKVEKHIVELSKSLPAITDKQREFGINKMHGGKMYVTKKFAICFECGGRFDTEKDLRESRRAITCPCCGRKIKNTGNKVESWNDYATFAILDTREEYQVIRHVHVMKHYVLNHRATYMVEEYIQNWVDEHGNITNLSVDLTSFMGNYNFVYGTKMQIRVATGMAYGYDPYKYLPIDDGVYPKMKLLPIIKRNGYHFLYNLNQALVMRAILTSTYAETLIKAKQDWLVPCCFERSMYNVSIRYHWKTIKLCIRNRYVITDPSNYFDYLDMLQEFGKDLLSPKYACPEKLMVAHDYYLHKKREKSQKPRDMETIARENDAFVKQKKLFFGLRFKERGLVIKPLTSVQEFYDEAEYMSHCLFTNAYYKKPNSLVLSARVRGKRMETVEVSLSNLSINQSRGRFNVATKYHNAIISLVSKNMPEIAKIIEKAHAVVN